MRLVFQLFCAAFLVNAPLIGCQRQASAPQITPPAKTTITPADSRAWDLQSGATSPWFETEGFRLELTDTSISSNTEFLPSLRSSSTFRMNGRVLPPNPNTAFALIPGLSISSASNDRGQRIPITNQSDYQFQSTSRRAPAFIIPGQIDIPGFRVDSPGYSLGSPVPHSFGEVQGNVGLLWASQVEVREIPFALASAIELTPGLSVTITNASFVGDRNVIVEYEYIARNSDPTYDPNKPPHLLYVNAVDESGDVIELKSANLQQNLVNHQGLHQKVRRSGSLPWEPKPLRSLRFGIAIATTPVNIPFALKNVPLSETQTNSSRRDIALATAAKRPVFDHGSFRVEAHQVEARLYSDLRKSREIGGSLTISLLLHVPVGDDVWAVGNSLRTGVLVDEAGESLLSPTSEEASKPGAEDWKSKIRYVPSDEGKRTYSASQTISAMSQMPRWLQRIEGEIPIVKAATIETFDFPFAALEMRELTDGFKFGMKRVEQADSQCRVEFEFWARPDNRAPVWQPPIFYEIVILNDEGREIHRHRYADVERTHEGLFGKGVATVRGRKNEKVSSVRVRVITQTEPMNIPFRFENWPVGRVSESEPGR